MRRVVRIVMAAIALLGAVRPAVAWCGGSDAENWREFYSLWGADLSRGEGRPVLFVVGAPWCPYCAELLKTYQAKPWRFDIRFVPKDAVNELHRNQLADIVVDGGAASIVRVFEQRRADTSKILPAVHKRINDVQLALLAGMTGRFAGPGRPLGSPTVFYLTRQGLVARSGMPNLAFVEQNILGDPAPVSRRTSRRFIASPLPVGKPVVGIPFAKRDNVRLRLLPEANGFSTHCVKYGHGSRGPVELIEVEGERWLAFKGMMDGAAKDSVVYGRASDFDGWRAR